MSDDTAPIFPQLSGTEQLPQVLTTRIAAVAWEKAAGDISAFQRLCAQHVRGDIDLFADNPPETDASERVRAAQMQEEIERAVLPAVAEAPGAVIEAPAEQAAPLARSVPRHEEPADDRG